MGTWEGSIPSTRVYEKHDNEKRKKLKINPDISGCSPPLFKTVLKSGKFTHTHAHRHERTRFCVSPALFFRRRTTSKCWPFNVELL